MRLTRRDVLFLTAVAAMPTPGWAASALVPQSDGFSAVVDADAAPRLVFDAGRWCEGPMWWQNALAFSDVRRDRLLRLGQDNAVTSLRKGGFSPANRADAAWCARSRTAA
ncbi:hypothetical protein P7D22_16020 [Lichenihabitans sp. Uapishka_5]|uniref:hypothetical protein n=1 Tax=Lichenihabitans sp. Uapishka_5 TaxID=3037302 RepID=UPI0029E82602|nr:hypothetical protein [Lichenihabitans sp. Uapishka_5]MDX7952676.1 hypothetical protein [Lichenihabitans sp. Uapishka_5]